jgi:hypothetical protein
MTGNGILDDLREWFSDHDAELARGGYHAELAESPPERQRRAVAVVISSSQRIGRLVVWDTGEAQLSMGEVSPRAVAEEYRSITSQAELRDATDTLVHWLDEP